MTANTRIQLSIMMFLEFLMWGTWYATLNVYMSKALNATGAQIGGAYSAVSLATIVSPFIVGMIADRYFAAQKFMGVLHLLGAAVMYYISTISDPSAMFWAVFIYSALFMPTLALANSVAFNQMSAPDKEFPSIRVWGTIGWIVIGLVVGALHFDGIENVAITTIPFKIGVGVSILLGIFSFFLPNTPPKAANTEGATISQILGLDAMVLFKDSSYLVFFIASILVCIPLSFYYAFTNDFLTTIGMENATGKMTMGQMSEIAFLILLPLFYKRLGIRNILITALLAWALRFLCFGFGDVLSGVWLLYLGIILHGVCFDFFFVSGMIYTEKKAGETIKSSAQGLITFATYGVGMFIGSFLSGLVKDAYTVNGATSWQSFWMVPTGITLVGLLFILLFFKDKN
jgi:nucleoside transporter